MQNSTTGVWLICTGVDLDVRLLLLRAVTGGAHTRAECRYTGFSLPWNLLQGTSFRGPRTPSGILPFDGHQLHALAYKVLTAAELSLRLPLVEGLPR